MEQSSKISKNRKVTINVHGGNVQVNSDAQDSTIIQNNILSNYSADELDMLIKALMKTVPSTISKDEVEVIQDSLEVIDSELSSQLPKKSLVQNAISTLKTIKGSVEFSAALVALIQYVQTLLK